MSLGNLKRALGAAGGHLVKTYHRWRAFDVSAILVAFGVVLGASITWAFLGGSSNASSERRALEQRAAELASRTLAPGSPLACLDALAGESVEAACENAIFASPANVAAATSYLAARLALLSDIAAYAGRGGAAIEASMPSRGALEIDRFGLLANLLATRDNCTSDNCKTLALLRDPSRVRTNLREQTFNHYLQRYLLVWAREAEPAIAAAPQVQAAAPVTAQANPPGQRKVVNIDFPSAASIPAVNIMNPEPSGPVRPGVAAAAAANPNPQSRAPASSRRSHKPAANSPAPAAAPPAAARGTQAAVEPIWPEPLSLQPLPAPAPGTAPAQPNPPPAPPPAGPATRVQ
jgi:hypothetical protein